MKIKTIEIFDFKSVKSEKINLNSPQLCLVGINESGKSNILEAISYLDIEKQMGTNLLNKEAAAYPGGFPMVSCVINIAGNRKLVALLKKNLKDLTGTSDELIGTALVQYKRWGNGFNNISLEFILVNNPKFSILDNLADKKTTNNFLDAFFELFPKIELFRNEDLLIDSASINEILNEGTKHETLRRLFYIAGYHDLSKLSTNDTSVFATNLARIETKINSILKEHYKQDQSISIRLVPSLNNKIELIIQDATNQSYLIHDRSPGFQYYFAFLINKIFYTEYFKDKSIIFLLDEPGSNLHPRGAKDLLRTFRSISLKSQIIYTTHNPFLILKEDIPSLYYVQKRLNRGTTINTKPWLNKYQVFRQDLGIMLNDSFLIGDVNLLVEGITEKKVLHHFFLQDTVNELEWLNIYNLDGVSNLGQTLRFLGPDNLNQRGVVLLDSDTGAKDQKKTKIFEKVIGLSTWDVIEINDVFKDTNQTRTFEDLFPQNLYIEAFNQYCKSIIPEECFSKKYEDFAGQTINTPIIDVLEKHLITFIKDDLKNNFSISKQEVAHLLIDKTKELSDEEYKEKMGPLIKLLTLIKEKIKLVSKDVNV